MIAYEVTNAHTHNCTCSMYISPAIRTGQAARVISVGIRMYKYQRLTLHVYSQFAFTLLTDIHIRDGGISLNRTQFNSNKKPIQDMFLVYR